jgi:SET domain-containing protein
LHCWERRQTDLEEVVKRLQASPHHAEYNKTQTILGLDIRHEIQIKLAKPALTKLEAGRVRQDLKRQYRESPHLSADEKDAAIEELSTTFEQLFSKPSATGKTVEIYKKEA